MRTQIGETCGLACTLSLALSLCTFVCVCVCVCSAFIGARLAVKSMNGNVQHQSHISYSSLVRSVDDLTDSLNGAEFFLLEDRVRGTTSRIDIFRIYSISMECVRSPCHGQQISASRPRQIRARLALVTDTINMIRYFSRSYWWHRNRQ